MAMETRVSDAAPRSDLLMAIQQEHFETKIATSHSVDGDPFSDSVGNAPDSLRKSGSKWTLTGVQVSQTRSRLIFNRSPKREAMKPA